MTMNKHTPGPWVITIESRFAPDGYTRVGTPDDGMPVAIVPSADDARLIAAAPDLYEALAGLLGDRTNPGLHRMEQDQIDAARTALSRASGST